MKKQIQDSELKDKLKELHKSILEQLKKGNYHIAAELCERAYKLKERIKKINQ